MFSLADRFVRIEIMTNRASSQASDLNITNPLRLCFSAVCLCLCVCVCVCLSTLRSLSLPLSLSVCLSVCLCLCLSLSLSLSVSLSRCLAVFVSVSFSVSHTQTHISVLHYRNTNDWERRTSHKGIYTEEASKAGLVYSLFLNDTSWCIIQSKQFILRQSCKLERAFC